MSPVTLTQRFYLGAVAVLALWVGIWCYFVPTMSNSAIPWLLPPCVLPSLGPCISPAPSLRRLVWARGGGQIFAWSCR